MRCISYRINRENIVTEVSKGWNSYALSNKAENLFSGEVVNRPLNEFISDPQTRHIYELFIGKVRETGELIRFSFRCDSPDKRRFMSMEIRPLDGESIEFHSCLEQEEEREPLSLLDTELGRSEQMLTICSWCKKIRIRETRWVEAEEAVGAIGMLGEQSLPQLTHGICPDCAQQYLAVEEATE